VKHLNISADDDAHVAQIDVQHANGGAGSQINMPTSWVNVGPASKFPPEGGAAIMHGKSQVSKAGSNRCCPSSTVISPLCTDCGVQPLRRLVRVAGEHELTPLLAPLLTPLLTRRTYSVAYSAQNFCP